MENEAKKHLSTVEAAKILSISRVAVFKKIKSGTIKADKVGRNYIIAKNEINRVLGASLSDERKKEIDQAIEKTVSEYGETLRLLGKE